MPGAKNGGIRPIDEAMVAVNPAADDVERMEFQLSLRRRGISDQGVLRAMEEVPRQNFVSPGFVESAYADQALPIECGQTISQPFVVAYMTEKLEVDSLQLEPVLETLVSIACSGSWTPRGKVATS